MNKKFLGLKISTYLTALICLIAAFLLWLFVNISGELPSSGATGFIDRFYFSL